VRALDPVKDLGQLLSYTGRFHEPAVRDPALEKIRSNPNLQTELAVMLRNNGVRMRSSVRADYSDNQIASRALAKRF